MKDKDRNILLGLTSGSTAFVAFSFFLVFAYSFSQYQASADVVREFCDIDNILFILFPEECQDARSNRMFWTSTSIIAFGISLACSIFSFLSTTKINKDDDEVVSQKRTSLEAVSTAPSAISSASRIIQNKLTITSKTRILCDGCNSQILVSISRIHKKRNKVICPHCSTVNRILKEVLTCEKCESTFTFPFGIPTKFICTACGYHNEVKDTSGVIEKIKRLE